MTEEFDAPCMGGPMAGQKLPYTYTARRAEPDEYALIRDDITLGKYEFSRASHSRRPTHGDQWNWHPYLGGMNGA